MKKYLYIIFIFILTACKPLESNMKTEINIVTKKNKPPLSKVAVLLPVNNTLNQYMAEVIWEEFVEELNKNLENRENFAIEVMSSKYIVENLNKKGYQYGDQLLQLNFSEKMELKDKLDVDALIFLTIDEIDGSNKNHYVKRTLKGSIEIFSNLNNFERYSFDTSKVTNISQEFLEAERMTRETPLASMNKNEISERVDEIVEKAAHTTAKILTFPLSATIMLLTGEISWSSHNSYFDNINSLKGSGPVRGCLSELDPATTKNKLNYITSKPTYKDSLLEYFLIEDNIYGGSFYKENIEVVVTDLLRSSDLLSKSNSNRRLAILPPVNNTYDDFVSELLLSELYKNLIYEYGEVQGIDVIENLLEAKGYYGEEKQTETILTHQSKNSNSLFKPREDSEEKRLKRMKVVEENLKKIATAEERLFLQNEMESDKLLYLTIEKASRSIQRDPFKVIKTIKGTSTLYMNGIEVNTVNFEGIEIKPSQINPKYIAKELMKRFSNHHDIYQIRRSIRRISDPDVRNEVIDLLVGVNNEELTVHEKLRLYDDKIIKKDKFYYSKAVSNAVENLIKTQFKIKGN